MNKKGLVFSFLAIVLGSVLVVFGGYDDSPGAQLLGLVIAVAGIVGVVKSKKNNQNI